jgi:predicted nucleic acid-binding protein
LTVASGSLLLDTSVVVHLARGNAIGQAMDRQYGLRERRERPLLSVVSVGELLSLARQWSWGDTKVARLRELLAELVVLDLQREAILERYAEMDAWCKANGFAIGNNDLWIAATSAAAGAVLLTNDRDFDPLDPQFVRRLYFEPPGPHTGVR